MKLIPGVTSSFNGAVSGTGGADAFNINGTRANQHEMTIDGASNIDTGNNGGTHVTINTDAIEEMKILTSNYQAEFGKAAGGQIAWSQQKAVPIECHGNARYFHRNEGMNANEWFARRTTQGEHQYPPSIDTTTSGYQVGGPIKKDRLFFFWGQEFYRQLVPVNGVDTVLHSDRARATWRLLAVHRRKREADHPRRPGHHGQQDRSDTTWQPPSANPS